MDNKEFDRVMMTREEKRSQKRKKSVQYARCPHCLGKVVITDADDPDRIVERHAKSVCWWVAAHGLFVPKPQRVPK